MGWLSTGSFSDEDQYASIRVVLESQVQNSVAFSQRLVSSVSNSAVEGRCVQCDIVHNINWAMD